MSTTTLDPMDLMSGFRLEDGRTWGQAAHPFQQAEAAAIMRRPGDLDQPPRRHFVLRGRGMSKTSDVAAMCLALMLTEAPPRGRGHIYAVDAEQASLFADALAGIVGRTLGLAGAVELGARSVTARATEAALSVESSDGATAYGTLPWLSVVDELGVARNGKPPSPLGCHRLGGAQGARLAAAGVQHGRVAHRVRCRGVGRRREVTALADIAHP